MLYMVVESYRGGDPAPVYRRLRERGRAIPAGVEYRGSWVTRDLARCFQLMQCDDRAALDRWIGAWSDLVDFEVVPVMTSAEAQEAVSAIS